MNARHLNKRIYGLVACGILAHAFLVAAPDDDAFSVAIPADLIRAHRIFSEEGVTFTEWRNGAPPLPQEAIERIKKRLGESVATANESFASSLLRQPYRIAADRSSYYAPADSTLERLGIGFNHDDLLLYVLTAPESFHILTDSGSTVPLWWIGLDSLEAFMHPSVSLAPILLAGGPAPYFQEMLSRTVMNWDRLDVRQRKHLLDIANRNDYQAILYRALRHGANSQLILIEKKFHQFERDMGFKGHMSGDVADSLVILGVQREGEAPLQFSVLTSQFPDGRWIPQNQSIAGIRPIMADLSGRRASVSYLQTRWNLKIGPKVETRETNLERLEPYLRRHCFGFVLDHLSDRPSLAAFIAEYQQARVQLQEIIRLSAALQEGAADHAALDQLLDNPYLGDALAPDVFHLLTAAEKFRQDILQRGSP